MRESAIEHDGSFSEKAGQVTKEFWSGTVYIANDLETTFALYTFNTLGGKGTTIFITQPSAPYTSESG